MRDLATKIWEESTPDGFPATAEGRAEVDRALRARLGAIGDESVRYHAAQLIRERRAAAMYRSDPSGLRGIVRQEIEAVLHEKGLIDDAER